MSLVSHATPQFKPNHLLMVEIRKGLDIYLADCGIYPTTTQGLAALTSAPQTSPICDKWGPNPYWNPKRYYSYTLSWYERLWRWIKSEVDITVPLDFWSHQYVYSYDESSKTYKLISYGRDGKEGGSGADQDLSSEEL